MNDRIRAMSEYVVCNDIYPPIVPVEYDEDDIELLPEAVKNAKRLKEFILAQTVRIDDWSEMVGLLKFDDTVVGDLLRRDGHMKFRKAQEKLYCKPIDNLITFEWEHANADFEYLINHGMEGYIGRIHRSMEKHRAEPERQFYLFALEMFCNTVIDWSEKCARECLAKAKTAASSERSKKLRHMAEVLRKVPRGKAETFEEAVQSLYMCFHFMPDSIGLADRYLLPFYRRDIENGLLTREHAKELIQELFTMINGFTVYTAPQADKGGESHFSIGGYWPDHTDGYNELSELILESMMELPYCRPQVTLRWTKKTPHEVLYHVMDLERHDSYKRIAFINDEARIPTEMKFAGISFEEACKYTMCGCNEPTFPGLLSLGGNNSNIARSLTNTLYNRTEEAVACENFDEFYDLYEQELRHDLREIHEYISLFNIYRTGDINIMSSLFLKGCIENGVSATMGGNDDTGAGTAYMGFVCVIDSLSIIKQFVYDEKRIDMAKLIEIMRNNWAENEELRLEILRDGKFYGNSYPLSDEIARRFTDSIEHFEVGYKGLFNKGAAMGNLTGYNPHYAMFGHLTMATPDGRHAGDPFGVGSGQNDGKDREGIPALLHSVATMTPSLIMNGGSVFNLKVDSTLVKNDDNFEKFVSLMEKYFEMGGLHFQLNYLEPGQLLDAQKHPDKYRNLRVRVSGFSAYFTTLDPDIQNDVIRRTMKRF